MSAEAGFCPLGILELNDLYPLDCFLADSEEARGDLGDHVVIVRRKELRVAAFAGAGEGVPDRCIVRLGNHGGQADGSERHTAAVNRGGDGHLGPSVVSPVQIDFRRDIRLVDLRWIGGEFKPQLIEAAAGVAHVVFNVGSCRRITGLGHDPGTGDHIRSPTEVAQRLIHGIKRQTQA